MSEHELWNELGNLYFLSGSYEQAIHAYTHAIILDENFGYSYSNMAQAYERMGRYMEAADMYRRSIQALNDECEKALCWHRLGDVQLQLKNYPRAVEAYQEADKFMPGDMDMQTPILLSSKLTLGEALPTKSAEEKPTPATDPSMELLPLIEELTPWWFEGQTPPEEDPEPDSDSQPVPEPDVAAYNENFFMIDTSSVTTLQPVMQEQRVAEMESLVAEPEPVTVITDHPEIVTLAPEYSTHDVASVEPVSHTTVSELPTVELSAEERALIEIEIEKFKRLLEINPHNAIAWDSLGGQYKALGQYDDALDAFQKAVSFDSSKASYFHHLGLVYAAVGRVQDAVAAFELVIEIDPGHSLAHAALGGYYRKNGKVELAEEHIEMARDLLPADENEYNRACFEAICGNSDYALDLLEIALKNKQTYVNWARRDPDLDFVRNNPRFHTLLVEYAARPTP